ncbi:hypothetical protein AGOR_G00154230 [Albula goreensis]|uniref:TNFR-Cys domain-containing protein n=1 Tax=Albula goreensis TaxID=1534307 RepID=A0A8T3CYU3_9TELE|nr:hypothetical protein AGOR_G00154230 [Albula goreensis]
MEFYHCASWSLYLVSLIGLVCSLSISGCPGDGKCGPGFGLYNCECVACKSNEYRMISNGIPRCKICTEQCQADRNLREVTACGPTENRVCHCAQGFLCEISSDYTCRRCMPCPAGTFSSSLSLKTTCQPHTNCTGLGLAVISNGNRTHDYQCASTTLSTDPHIDPSSSTAAITHTPPQASSLPSRAQAAPKNTSQLPPEHHASPPTPLIGSSPTVGLLVMLLVVAMLAACYMCHKSYVLKTRGWSFLKYLQVEGKKEETTEADLHVLSKTLLSTKTADMPQQVTVDHSGTGDSVSNTVGSIYIYSPGMVVLGANSSDQKEEAGPPGEGPANLGNPQQESHVVAQERACVQEEEYKDLCYPVPATGK